MMKIGIDNVLISRMKDLNPAFPKTYLSKKSTKFIRSLSVKIEKMII